MHRQAWGEALRQPPAHRWKDLDATRAGAQWIVPIAAAAITLSALGGTGAWFAATARLPFVAGLDRYLPAAFGALHPRWKTPHVALYVQAAFAFFRGLRDNNDPNWFKPRKAVYETEVLAPFRALIAAVTAALAEAGIPLAGDPARRAAGVVHSDFERGFIKAETVAYEDLAQCGSVAAARERGLYRMEGKEYVVQDGDIINFRFST